jgi:hypothetical protein
MGATMKRRGMLLSSDQSLRGLRVFLLKKSFYEEAYVVGKIVLASGDQYLNSYQEMAVGKTKDVGTDKTVALGPGARSWRSPSEPHLLRAGLDPIRFVAGTESAERGTGKASEEGNIYEVLYKGRVAAAKVLGGIDPAEPEVWRKIIKIKDSLPEEQAKHLPEIYDIIKTDKYTTIIVMELLEAPSPHIRRVLRTKEMRSKDLVLKNEDFLTEALRSAFNAVEKYEPDLDDRAKSEVYALFTSDKEVISQTIEGELLRWEIKPEGISERIQDIVSFYTKNFNIDDAGLSKEIADEVQKRFLMYAETSPRPVAKYYSTKDIDSTIQFLERNNDPGSVRSERAKKTIEDLSEERSESVYSETPESFLYSEKYMPETKGLFTLLSSLKALGIEWSDVHANNLMERPGTRDLVLIDVGFFT